MPNMLESCYWDERTPHKRTGWPQDELLLLVPWLLGALSRRDMPGIWGAPEARLPSHAAAAGPAGRPARAPAV